MKSPVDKNALCESVPFSTRVLPEVTQRVMPEQVRRGKSEAQRTPQLRHWAAGTTRLLQQAEMLGLDMDRASIFKERDLSLPDENS